MRTISAQSSVGYALCLLLSVGAYLEVPLGLGGASYIPAFFVLALSPVLAIYAREEFRPDDYRLCISVFLFSMFSAFLAPNWDDLASRLWGVLQITSSAVLLVLTIRTLLTLSRTEFVSLFTFLYRALLALTFLEYIGFTQGVSDAFREAAYGDVGGYGVYGADYRDLFLAGHIRPKVFTSEPSLVALGFVIFSSAAAFAQPSSIKVAEITLASILEIAFLGSPIVLLAPAIAYLPLMFPEGISNASGKAVFAAVVGAIVLILIFSIAGFDSWRFERFSRSNFDPGLGTSMAAESSERLRLVNPYLAIIDAWTVNFLTGLGISGKRSLLLYSTVAANYEVAMGNNAFASYFVYFGLLGTPLFFYILISYFRSVRAWNSSVALAIILVLQTIGASESARIWIFVGILIAAGAQAARARGRLQDT